MNSFEAFISPSWGAAMSGSLAVSLRASTSWFMCSSTGWKGKPVNLLTSYQRVLTKAKNKITLQKQKIIIDVLKGSYHEVYLCDFPLLVPFPAIIESSDIILILETMPRTDQFSISPYKYLYIVKHTGGENRENHQLDVALMYPHITRHVENQ